MRRIGVLLLLIASVYSLVGQNVLIDEGKDKLQFSGGVQLWMRYTDLNPGSTIQDTPVRETVDVSIRRIRLAIKGQLSQKWSYNVSLGANNLSALNPNPNLAILDVEATYAFRSWLEIGGGRIGYNGFSRFSTPSTMSTVGHDWPIFSAPTINISDDLLRRMGVFVKGQIGRIDYRSALSRPLLIQGLSEPSTSSTFSSGLPGILRSFYLKYQLLDKESNGSAFATGTYLGTKRVLNLGIGGQLQRDAFLTETDERDTVYHDMIAWSVDLFFDAPLTPSNRTSMNFYLAYYNYNFGPDYIRNIGANNPATGGESGGFNGIGNSYPAIGTGEILFIQGAIRLGTPKFIQGLQAIQPYASIQYADYDGLDDIMTLIDTGLSFLFNGHSSKFNIGYQSRPIFEESAGKVQQINRKDMVILQYQLRF